MSGTKYLCESPLVYLLQYAALLVIYPAFILSQLHLIGKLLPVSDGTDVAHKDVCSNSLTVEAHSIQQYCH